ncbi:hypothetical protein EV360DRAFT_72353 [Lentinula raphanica]|nr:hypothetical protein EV360DRAFT_72353 [Lentinula raphanica]
MTRPVLAFPLSLTFVFLASTVAPASEVLTAPTSFHERRWIDDLDQPDHSRLSRIAVINDHGPHLQGSSTALASAQRRDVSIDILDVHSVDSNRYEELGDEHQSERGSIAHRRDRHQVFDSFVTSRSVENKHAEEAISTRSTDDGSPPPPPKPIALDNGHSSPERSFQDIKNAQERLTQLKETLEKRPGGKEKFAEGNSQVIEGLLDDIREIEQIVVSQKDAKQEHELYGYDEGGGRSF